MSPIRPMLFALAMSVSTSPLVAQVAPDTLPVSASDTTAISVSEGSVMLATQTAGVRPHATPSVMRSESELSAPVARRLRKGGTLMIVGGAAFVIGLVMEDDHDDDIGTLFMVGGAAIGLYGLYLHLQGR